jgi:glycosyltransferase involved in cell wall biosynthesis
LGYEISHINLKQSKISGIVLSYNSQETLEESLSSLRMQSHPLDEIIVIDDGSKDHSQRIATTLPCRLLSNSSNRGRGYSRNLGVKSSASDMLLFCDSSNLLPTDFVQKAIHHFNDSQVAAVFGRIQNDNRLKDCYSRWRGRHLFREHLPFRKDVHGVDCLITYAVIMRKKSVVKVGNFNPDLPSCEDIELGRKLLSNGYKILSDPSLCCYSIRRENLTSLCIRFNRWFSQDEETFNPMKSFVQSFRTIATIYLKEDLKAKDFSSFMISLSLPFMILLLGILTPDRFR